MEDGLRSCTAQLDPDFYGLDSSCPVWFLHVFIFVMMIFVVLQFYWLVLEMLFGCMFFPYAFHACSRESVPFIFKQAGLAYG